MVDPHAHLKNKGKAVVVGVQLPDESDDEHLASLAELKRLANTLGFEVVGTMTQKRKAPHSGTILGEGKLDELAKLTRDDDEDSEAVASVVIFDCELTPTQLENLEQATGAEVLDRTGVIVEIFSRHAKTREAKLQVEIAKLSYMAPRLRASRVGGDRQGGGIGGRGAGESAHQLDKRRIRDRISELRRQLDSIAVEHSTRRARRAESNKVALVGYTNAGKSSMMRALTGSEVLVEDKLFATLDTTVRALHPVTVPKILLSDTVGFIKKLPHDLVASFRSTLDEAHAASLLLFVVDATDPTFRSQLEVTRKVLSEIGVQGVEQKLILNKSDQLNVSEIASLRTEYPNAMIVSTKVPADVVRMRKMIIDFFERDMREHQIHVSYQHAAILGKIRTHARVIGETYDEYGIVVTLIASDATWNQIASWKFDLHHAETKEGSPS